jgi:hypothetical protein
MDAERIRRAMEDMTGGRYEPVNSEPEPYDR